jgi:hypothetical protein
MRTSFSIYSGIISLELILNFLSLNFSYSQSSFETDRGYREPAVLGPAIVDETVETSRAEDTSEPINYFDIQFDRGSEPEVSVVNEISDSEPPNDLN